MPVVQDLIVEGGTTTDVPPPFGNETFVASLAASSTDLMGRLKNDNDTSTATITDDDAATVSLDKTKTDKNASEPGHTPNFENGEWTIQVVHSSSNLTSSSTATKVKFQMTGDAVFGDDYDLTTTGANLTDLGGGMFSVDIPAHNASPKSSIKVTLVPINDKIIEDDEFATLELKEILSSDPQVTLSTSNLSDTIQLDDDDQAAVSVKSDVASGGDPSGTETNPPGGDNGKFVILLSDENGDPGNSDSTTIVEFQVTLPILNPPNGQATPGVDYNITGSDLLSFNTTTGRGTVAIPAGQPMTMLTVEVLNDSDVELTEEVTLTVTDTISNADIVVDTTMDQAVVEISDNGDGLYVSVDVAASDLVAAETLAGSPPNPGFFVIQLTDGFGNRVNAPEDVVVVYDIITNSTAFAPGDFTGVVSNSVTIVQGFSQALVQVNPVDDTDIEGTEVVNLKVTSGTTTPTPGMPTILLGTLASTPLPVSEQVEILDNELPPVVSGVVINNGDDQRSDLRIMTVEFNSQVTIAPDAFIVEKRDDATGAILGTVGGVNFTTALVGGKTVATLTFTPNSTFVDGNGSLVDGNYELTVDATKVYAGNLVYLDGNGDGTGGDDYDAFGTVLADEFYRLFGDANGDGGVDQVDVMDFMIPALNSTVGDANYDAALDANGDGGIDQIDVMDYFIPALNKTRPTGGF